jgi:anti-sigma B factor antagonist
VLLDISTADHGGRTVVHLDGELDAYTAPRLAACLDDLRRQAGGGAGAVVVDLTRVTFVDSTGLGVLVTAHRAAGGGSLQVVAPDPRVRRVFEMTSLDRLLTIRDSLADALG